ncbi:condensation domain-containing protein, partial [Streptomyces xiamenensis]|uniref:condensation domain-containing protein n=1 Tax=Streptomyces xiamenensis TaxID=408015 RepID=UPI0036B7AAB7
MIPLSHAQHRLWLIDQVEGPTATYNVPLVLRLRGDLDTAALRTALHDVVGRHESLRTLFPTKDDIPHQRIVPADRVDIALEVTDVAGRPYDEQLAAVDERARTPFALASELPLRAHLFRGGPEDHTLLVLMHHIVSDGWSLAPLARDLATAYTARTQHTQPDWEPLPV